MNRERLHPQHFRRPRLRVGRAGHGRERGDRVQAGAAAPTAATTEAAGARQHAGRPVASLPWPPSSTLPGGARANLVTECRHRNRCQHSHFSLLALLWEPGKQDNSATQWPSSSPWSKEQTRVKHSVQQTPVCYEQWDRATRGTRRVATPSRKWERARKNDNLDQKLLRRLGTPRMKREDQKCPTRNASPAGRPSSGLARAWPEGVPARYDHTGQNLNVEP